MSRAVEALLAVLARRCEGPFTFVSEDPAAWTAARLETLSPGEVPSSAPAGSLVLAVDLMPLTDSGRSELITEAWERLRPGASLILLTPNPAALSDPASAPERRDVKRLLRPCGRVRKWKDQPFRWLVFSSVKRGEGSADVDAEELARYAVTAELCRGRVLELGCGRGDLSGLLLERGHEVTGCDLAARKVEEAARRFPAGKFQHADILELDLPAGSFDTVLLPEVLEHADETVGQALLEKAWSFVAPGGRFVVTVPNEDNLPHANHLREFDRSSLAALLQPFPAHILQPKSSSSKISRAISSGISSGSASSSSSNSIKSSDLDSGNSVSAGSMIFGSSSSGSSSSSEVSVSGDSE